jgi:hypothetical protein
LGERAFREALITESAEKPPPIGTAHRSQTKHAISLAAVPGGPTKEEKDMRLAKILSLAAIVTVAAATAAPASAQGSVSFGFSKFGRCSGFGLGFTVPINTRCWVAGHYETRAMEVWVPGACERVWVEPAYDVCTDPCGNTTRVLVRAGYYRTIQHPGYYETRYVQVWVPGHYE